VASGLVLAAGAGRAAAQEPSGWTAPAYPGNTLTMTHDGPIVAGTVVRVQMSGHAEWGGPTDESTTGYDLYLYAAGRSARRSGGAASCHSTATSAAR
jgi:hypothetical protein